MLELKDSKPWVRELVDFALNQDIDEEIECQKEILKEHPDWAEGHYNLGVLFYSQGLIEESMKEFLTSMECDPSYGPAYRRLGELYVGIGDYESGARYAALAAERGDSTLLDSFKRYPSLSALLEGIQEGSESIRRPASLS
ncbi:MAG TPA: hypothetical protein VEZ90_11925 [Blastocatellia bacterium]|nr:hypothetical protein [Blastocatellia bacterium]